ncbi:MAG TPA: hypothetical protein VHZ55_31785 [Bryobacteraceae bacterium]|nr:hypothetical protein [Bryobacteraceae bacterium]
MLSSQGTRAFAAPGKPEWRSAGSLVRARELLDHIIPLNEYHFRRLGRDYLTNTIKTELTLAWTRTPLPNEPSKGVLAFKP